jgi:4'-phosphopantetheinyl transferase EntD
MHTWKMSKTLTNSLDPQWQMLSSLTLGEGVHSDRKNGFLLARQALQNCLAEVGVKVSPARLNLRNFHQLENVEQFTLSLSHTSECGAAMIADRKFFRSVGIDIEREDRVVKDSIRERITHKDDTNFRNIEIWCLKEAVFKALMNTEKFEKPLEFSSICIGKDSWSHSPSGLEGKWEVETIKPFVVARAFLQN